METSKSKNSRIKLTKICEYIKALAVNGTYIPDRYVKHLEGEIWELRPINDRILFAGWVNGTFVLLHSFVKKTQKTPKREIEQALQISRKGRVRYELHKRRISYMGR